MGAPLPMIELGRAAFERAAWRDAFAALSEADATDGLPARDLELLARAAYMLGDTTAYVDGLERAHRVYLDAGDVLPAVRAAFWVGHSLLFRGQDAAARGWFARAQRLFGESGLDGSERGWLLIPMWLAQMWTGDYAAGYETAGQAAAIGRQYGDADLLWLARGEQGRALMNMGRVADGLRLVDEMFVVMLEGQLSPVVTGIVYCNTIAYCVDGFAFGHARDWTEALNRWCERQPEMEEHFGFCLVHRAELHHLSGSWDVAHEESQRAAARHTAGQLNQWVRGKAAYVDGEMYRLGGDFGAAEEAYREANTRGFEPQPGLALLRLAQSRGEAAAAAIRRAIGEAGQTLRRARLLPAYVEIMLAVGELDRARAATDELDEIASSVGDGVRAMASYAHGSLLLANNDAAGALAALRRSLEAWQRIDVPYEVARTRVLIAACLRAVGDHDTADLEQETARRTFAELGAERDVARVDQLIGRAGRDGLTSREVEVLQQVAAGRSNSEIASALFISEHTVARHLQNIFAKIGVSSRTAAAAYAHTRHLA